MIAFAFCFLALISSFVASRRSTGTGLVAVLAWGYGYGILRANFPTVGSHFIFDCSLIGFYGTQFRRMLSNSSARLRTLNSWVFVLIAWPCIVCFFPFQSIFVSLVGLRGNIFFLPMLLVGASLTAAELGFTAKWVAGLNLIAISFAVAEYVLGVPRFFPPNEVTEIIYASHDVAGYNFFRIPSVFGTAHLFGGTMVTTLPLLFGLWAKPDENRFTKILALLGMVAALFGVLLSSTRLHFLIATVLTLGMALSREMGMKGRVAVVMILIGIGMVAVTNQRMSRFKSLGDGGGVGLRIGGSVNRNFGEAIREYPMGNGLGGGGTSIPYFLMDQVKRPVVMENEYGRIALELGVIGLLLWGCFIGWFATSSAASAKTPWQAGRRLGWLCVVSYWGSALIGLGTLTSIPQTALFLVIMGWVAAKPRPEPVPVPETTFDIGPALLLQEKGSLA